jgi:hypothetical protein
MPNLSQYYIAILVLGPLVSVSAQSQSFVRVNQLGYQIRDIKTAVAFGAQPVESDFAIANADDGTTVWRGQTTLISNAAWGQFHYYAQCDFSGLQKPQHYVLRLGPQPKTPRIPPKCGNVRNRPLRGAFFESTPARFVPIGNS